MVGGWAHGEHSMRTGDCDPKKPYGLGSPILGWSGEVTLTYVEVAESDSREERWCLPVVTFNKIIYHLNAVQMETWENKHHVSNRGDNTE